MGGLFKELIFEVCVKGRVEFYFFWRSEGYESGKEVEEIVFVKEEREKKIVFFLSI